MTELIKVDRNERKYVISTEMYSVISNRISGILESDENGSKDGYFVRTLYFDSMYDSDYHDKIDGLMNRKKIRLRIYDLESDSVKIEVKEKSSEFQTKRSMIISRKAALDLIEGKYSTLLDYNNPFTNELYIAMSCGLYRPKCIIEYTRKAFLMPENSIRLTFDHSIKSTETSFDFFSPNLNMNPMIPSDCTVFEVKYNNFLFSHIKDLIRECDKTETSFSKYCEGRKSLYY